MATSSGSPRKRAPRVVGTHEFDTPGLPDCPKCHGSGNAGVAYSTLYCQCVGEQRRRRNEARRAQQTTEAIAKSAKGGAHVAQ